MRSAVSGRLITGRYRLGSVIGHGGMGVVWRARDELLGRDVAVKELSRPPDLTEQEWQTACRRTVREARTTARLTHPNIIRIYDIVEEDDGQPWIVMELLPYRSLRDLVQEDGPLDPARAAQVGLGVLAALRAAHAEGIVHRDVTPANILVGPGERAVLTDFGIARAVGSPTLTSAGAVMGSPSYIAPERARGAPSGTPGDLWGLGASLYAAVEGHPPFERPHALATLTAVVADEPERAGHAGPLWPLISALLRKDPDARPDEAETERLLRGVAPGARTRVPAGERRPPAPVPPGPVTPPGPPAGQASSRAGQAAARRGRPRGTLAALAVLAALGAAAVVVTLALTSSDSPGHRTVSPAAGTSSAGASPGTSAGSTAKATPARHTSPASETPPSQPSRPQASPPGRPTNGPGGRRAGQHTGQGALPAGFYRFTNPTGFSIGVPDGWQASRKGHYVYLQDPANSGIYLLIDQSNNPKSDPLSDWRQQQANRASGYPGYHLIRLESVSYPQAEKAADWEFTYDQDGVTVHILNRNILANAHHAYALYWSVPAAEWEANYHYFQAFAATFQPAS
jgi:serine/threonine protein kinase